MPDTKDILKLLNRGNIGGALILADDVKNKREITELLNDYAVILINVDDYETAEKLFKKAINIDPTCSELYYNLGCLYSEPELLTENPKNLERAIEAYKKAIRVKPNHVNAHYDLGLLYAFTNKKKEAKGEYSKLLKIAPKDTPKLRKLKGAIEGKI